MRGQKRVKDAHERPFDPRIHLLGKQVPCQATLKKSLGRVLINPAQCPLRSERDDNASKQGHRDGLFQAKTPKSRQSQASIPNPASPRMVV
jgi:hypothetical protein